MDEKKIVYQVIVDCWSLFKDHIATPMNDNEWERVMLNAHTKSEKYRNENVIIWYLFRDIYSALEHYKQERDRREIHGSKKHRV